MSRPAVEVADLLRAQGDRFYSQSPWLSYQQLSVLRAITRCRTAALGGHIDTCPGCSYEGGISYNSCLMGSLF
jgi:Transposase zinc-binding domain